MAFFSENSCFNSINRNSEEELQEIKNRKENNVLLFMEKEMGVSVSSREEAAKWLNSHLNLFDEKFFVEEYCRQQGAERLVEMMEVEIARIYLIDSIRYSVGVQNTYGEGRKAYFHATADAWKGDCWEREGIDHRCNKKYWWTDEKFSLTYDDFSYVKEEMEALFEEGLLVGEIQDGVTLLEKWLEVEYKNGSLEFKDPWVRPYDRKQILKKWNQLCEIAQS